MFGSLENLLQILEGLHVPTAFIGVMLTVLLALTLAPFLGGLKVGPVEIPKLPLRSRQGLMVGTLVAWVLLLVPMFPVETPDPPCLLTAKTQVADTAPQKGTLDGFLRDFETTLEFGHEIPVRIRYDESLQAAGWLQHRFTLERRGVPQDGCQLLTEIADGLNRQLLQEDHPLRVTIFASCQEVFVAPRDTDRPSREFEQCS